MYGSLSGDDLDESGGGSEEEQEQERAGELHESGEEDEVEGGDSDSDSLGGAAGSAEAAVALLRGMGFLASAAQLALQACRRNVQAAVAYLVN